VDVATARNRLDALRDSRAGIEGWEQLGRDLVAAILETQGRIVTGQRNLIASVRDRRLGNYSELVRALQQDGQEEAALRDLKREVDAMMSELAADPR
jgi:hypothetical protein